MGSTTVEVSDETWRKLNRRKNPGETFDKVIADLLAGERGVEA